MGSILFNLSGYLCRLIGPQMCWPNPLGSRIPDNGLLHHWYKLAFTCGHVQGAGLSPALKEYKVLFVFVKLKNQTHKINKDHKLFTLIGTTLIF